MLTKPRLKGLGLFLAGFLMAVVMMYGLFMSPGAQAGSCELQDLKAAGSSSDPQSGSYQVYYDIPSCVPASGYRPAETGLVGSNQVYVKYKKK